MRKSLQQDLWLSLPGAFSRMTICSHQFHGGDGSDWVLSTSVGCLDGSTTASRILQELFKTRCRNLPTETSTKCPKTVIASSANVSPSKLNPKIKKTESFAPVKHKEEPEETLIVRKMPGISALEYFDESQHLNGCPMKWFHNKRLLEKNKRFKVQRLCSNRLPPKKEEVKREKSNNLRDRTPVEVKIHKINLTEKYTANSDDVYAGEAEGHRKDLEDRRRTLAAKLNWKLHDDSQNEFPFEPSQGSRHNYFPPRPLLGLKPLLSILLAPHKTNCCCLVTQLRAAPPERKGKEASLSVQSLDLPLPQPEQKPRLSTTNALRWGSKSCVNTKKLQIPNQITLKLDRKTQKSVSEPQDNGKLISYNPPPAKRLSAGRKQTKSLSSLFYELRGKTSHRAGQKEEVFEEMIRDLTAEGQFKLKRFLNLDVENTDWVRGCKSCPGKKEKFAEEEEEEPGGAKDPNLICGKIRFFKKILPAGSKRRSW